MSGKAFKRIGEKSTPESKEAVRKEIKAIMETKDHQLRIILATLLRERSELNKNPEANLGDIEDIVEKAVCKIEEEYGNQRFKEGMEERKWISVKHRLPEVGERCLVYCYSQGVQMCYRGLKNGDTKWLMAFDCSEAYLNITHWKYLPEIPDNL